MTPPVTSPRDSAPASSPAPLAADQKAYDAIVAGLGDDADPEVKVSKVDESSDGAATATLSWTWKLGDNAWTYDTEAALKRSDGTWTASFAPSVVEPSLGDGDRLSATTLTAKRGNITGAGGVALVKPRRVERFGLDKSKAVAGPGRDRGAPDRLDPRRLGGAVRQAGQGLRPQGVRRGHHAPTRRCAPGARRSSAP